ncbi:hypothetical protein F915_00754, partial [Acinetobacter baumannii NIPH 70]
MNLTTFLLKPKLFLTDSLFYAVITPIIAYFFVFFNQIIPYSQTTLLFIQDSKKTRNNSSTESINHSLRLR